MNRRNLRKLAKKITSRKNRPLIYGLLFTLAAAVTALACGWSYVTDHSVRFNSYRTGRGFYRLPPLPVMYDNKTKKELTVREIENYDYFDYPASEADYADLSARSEEDMIWEKARTAVQETDLATTQDLLTRYLKITAEPSVGGGADQQEQRNTARDILDAMSAVKLGSGKESVAQYINARYSFHYKDQNLGDLISHASGDKNLNDNWEYLKAASLYSAKDNTAALDAFRKHAAKFPQSEKNEAVMYMIAKLTMESSQSFTNNNCGSSEKEQLPKIEPVENCRDENWHLALKAFQRLMQRYPEGRYFNDARGWLAFLYERDGDRARALAEYYSLLSHPTDRSVRLKAKFNLQYLGHEQDDATLDQVEQLITNDADTALAYAYHRIYNHAIDLTYTEYSTWCCYDENKRWQQEQEEKKRVTDSHNAGNHELTRIAEFATAMMKRHPQARVSGAFVLRVAEAQLELQNYSEAEYLSKKALGFGLQNDLRAEALWVKGSAQHRQKDLKGARTTFSQLITEFPNAKLTEGARRLLAITAEDQDDLEFALEQYLALDYRADVAYYLDVLLPTDRLAKFVDEHKNIPQHNQLLYSLGIRYMRDKRWNDARAALRQVRTEAEPTADYQEYNNDDSRQGFVKDPGWGWEERPFIRTAWAMRDLKTIDVLEHLEKAVETAQDDEAKAEAMYQLASYQFDADELLFYNPAIWVGQRYWLLSDLDSSNRLRLPNEPQIIFDYSQSHETLARAIPIYLEIVTRFPKTRAAKDALYTAAVAHQHLSNLNPYWRSIYEQGLFAGPRMVTYADVKRAYPNYQLPRGTNGWEASTRTVNGGPGWAPKPKPAPPLTRTQKFERRLEYMSEKFDALIKPWLSSGLARVQSLINGYILVLNTCLSWLLWIVGMLLVCYVAVLGVHFRVPLLAAARRLTGPEIRTEQLPLEELLPSDSRVEKVIDETDTVQSFNNCVDPS